MVLCFVPSVRKLSYFFPNFESNLQPVFLTIFYPLAIVTEQPECRVDPDCPSKLACISETCQNPCVVNNPCSNSQKCVVIDSQPSRSVACICPEGSVFGGNGICTQGMWRQPVLNNCTLFHDKVSLIFQTLFPVQVRPQCTVNEDCPYSDICQLGNCIDACRATKCGTNAVCSSSNHRAECSCIHGFKGDPFTACRPRKI